MQRVLHTDISSSHHNSEKQAQSLLFFSHKWKKWSLERLKITSQGGWSWWLRSSQHPQGSSHLSLTAVQRGSRALFWAPWALRASGHTCRPNADTISFKSHPGRENSRRQTHLVRSLNYTDISGNWFRMKFPASQELRSQTNFSLAVLVVSRLGPFPNPNGSGFLLLTTLFKLHQGMVDYIITPNLYNNEPQRN